MSGRLADTRPPGAPLWTSAFRPLYLLGAAYAVALGTVWSGAWLGGWTAPAIGASLALWHGHEMIFGVVAAIAAGIVLTALPSWAGTDEVQGRGLALLASLWLLGRIACWIAPGELPWLDGHARAVADALFLAAVLARVTPQLLHVSDRRYLLLLPILAWLVAANLAWHAGTTAGNGQLAAQGLRAAVHALVVLFVLTGGVLTPVFTGNELRASGRGEQARFVMALEVAALVAVLALAVLDIGGAPARWSGAAALACALVHGWRVVRWKGWRAADVPLVLVMHIGFAWLVLAFALKAASGLGGLVPETAWLHAFTIGAVGTMMLGLMTRVVLRHTGRALVVPLPMLWAWGAMSAAALLRLAPAVRETGSWTLALAALLWMLPFAVFLGLFARMLVTPSLPFAPRTIE